MIIKDNKTAHLEELLKNNSETSSNEDKEMLENIKVTIEKNKEVIEQNRKILDLKKQREATEEWFQWFLFYLIALEYLIKSL